MTSFLYFGNISVKILANNSKFDSFKIYIERAIEKYPRGQEINKTKVETILWATLHVVKKEKLSHYKFAYFQAKLKIFFLEVIFIFGSFSFLGFF